MRSSPSVSSSPLRRSIERVAGGADACGSTTEARPTPRSRRPRRPRSGSRRPPATGYQSCRLRRVRPDRHRPRGQSRSPPAEARSPTHSPAPHEAHHRQAERRPDRVPRRQRAAGIRPCLHAVPHRPQIPSSWAGTHAGSRAGRLCRDHPILHVLEHGWRISLRWWSVAPAPSHGELDHATFLDRECGCLGERPL